MDDLDLISTGLYRGINRIVGFEAEVKMRRLVMDLQHEMRNVRYNFEPVYEAEYLSGSEAEGLRFASSDHDYMTIIRGVRVIYSYSQLPLDNNTTLLLAEFQAPGFVLLRPVTSTNDPLITDSCIRHGDHCYVASSLWRNQFLFLEQMKVHGPCTGYEIGNQELDFAYCIRSDIWPQCALGCIQRMHHAGWPSREVVSKIVQNGCLFVAIGSKESPTEDYEWRLSFSLAEKILTHNMTHCQFLMYGLLKIFLKQAIDVNPKVKGLLCSYFLKTTLFWKIINGEDLSENDFLKNFWKCFQTLIIYVASGYCPNFFMPKNNMFRGKIHGVAQRDLLAHLLSLYRDGYRCLLQCPSVHGVMSVIFGYPVIATGLSSETSIDGRLILEIWNRAVKIDKRKEINLANLLYMEILLPRCSSTMARFVVKCWMKMLMVKLAVNVSKQTVQMHSLTNTKHYYTKQFLTRVAMSSAHDVGSHLFYLAIGLFHFRDFAAVIKILLEIKRRIQHPCLMYVWNIDEDKYIAAGGGTTPVRDMMKTAIAFPVRLKLMNCIPGLEPEHEAGARHFAEALLISPLVCANFLLFHCYTYEQNTVQANAVLDELFTLVHYDNEYHIHETQRATSWQLLGICQELNGDYQGAYNSYHSAMQQKWCPIKSASELRIRNMCS